MKGEVKNKNKNKSKAKPQKNEMKKIYFQVLSLLSLVGDFWRQSSNPC